jgi:hypothetical protein
MFVLLVHRIALSAHGEERSFDTMHDAPAL